MNKNKQRSVGKQSMESGVQSAPSEARCCFCIKKGKWCLGRGWMTPHTHTSRTPPTTTSWVISHHSHEQKADRPGQLGTSFATSVLSGLKERPVGVQSCPIPEKPNDPSFKLKSKYVSMASQVALVVKNLPANAGDARDTSLIPGLGRSPGKGNGQPTPEFLPGKCHGQRSLAGYSPWGSQRVGHD